MVKKVASLVVFVLILPCIALFAEASRIEGFFVFTGDQFGDFRGDPVILLNDGSYWKVHFDDTDTVYNWCHGDTIRISRRGTKYFFKREHKFLLINETAGETARVMITEYGSYPLYITNIEGPFAHGDEEMEKVVHVSDGSTWIINDHRNEFHAGALVHYGCKECGDDASVFLITGVGRDATWTPARRERP